MRILVLLHMLAGAKFNLLADSAVAEPSHAATKSIVAELL